MTRKQRQRKLSLVKHAQAQHVIWNKKHPEEATAKRKVFEKDNKIRYTLAERVRANKKKREAKRKNRKVPGDKLATTIWGKKVIIALSPRKRKMTRKKK